MVQNSISIKECTVKIRQFIPPAIQFPCLETILSLLFYPYTNKNTHICSAPHFRQIAAHCLHYTSWYLTFSVKHI